MPISKFLNHASFLSHKFAGTTGTNLMTHVNLKHEIVVHRAPKSFQEFPDLTFQPRGSVLTKSRGAPTSGTSGFFGFWASTVGASSSSGCAPRRAPRLIFGSAEVPSSGRGAVVRNFPDDKSGCVF